MSEVTSGSEILNSGGRKDCGGGAAGRMSAGSGCVARGVSLAFWIRASWGSQNRADRGKIREGVSLGCQKITVYTVKGKIHIRRGGRD